MCDVGISLDVVLLSSLSLVVILTCLYCDVDVCLSLLQACGEKTSAILEEPV